MSVKVTHALISGTLPGDGRDIEEALDLAATRGFYILDTCVTAVDEHSVYYIAVLAQQVETKEETPITRRAIGMGAGKSSHVAQQADPHVDTNADAKPVDPE